MLTCGSILCGRSLNLSKYKWGAICRGYATLNRPETSQTSTLIDIGTRNIFNEDHDMFRKTVRKFFVEEVSPHVAEWDAAGKVSREIWKRAGSVGILGIDVPVEYGGSGSDFLTATIAIEEQAYILYNGTGFNLHSNVVQQYVMKYGTEEQRKRFVPRMLAGELITAIAMTESAAGSDLQGIKTNAKMSGSDWVLNGSKIYITNGYLCDMVIVAAITDATSKKVAHGLSLFLVEDGMAGFKKGGILKKIGMHGLDTGVLFFEDVRLPQSALLGEANHGFYYLMNELPRERLANAVASQAACEAMFELTRKFVIERKAFGKRIADLQTVQHKLAEMKTKICLGRVFIDKCILLQKEKRLDSATASMAKYWISDLQNRVAYDCVQLHGGAGYMNEYPISRAFVDARVIPIFSGSNEIMKELISRSIVK